MWQMLVLFINFVFQVNQEVHIVQESNPDWWYGVCEDRCGYFPPSNVQTLRASTTTKVNYSLVSRLPDLLHRQR